MHVEHDGALLGQEVEEDRGVVGHQDVDGGQQLIGVDVLGDDAHRQIDAGQQLLGQTVGAVDHEHVITGGHGGQVGDQGLAVQLSLTDPAAPGGGEQDQTALIVLSESQATSQRRALLGAHRQRGVQSGGAGDDGAAPVDVEQIMVLHQRPSGELIGRHERGAQLEVALQVLVVEQTSPHGPSQGLEGGAVPGVEVALLAAAHEVGSEGDVVDKVPGGGEVLHVLGAVQGDEDDVATPQQIRGDGAQVIDGPHVDEVGVLRPVHHPAEDGQGVAADRGAVVGLPQHQVGADGKDLQGLGVADVAGGCRGASIGQWVQPVLAAELLGLLEDLAGELHLPGVLGQLGQDQAVIPVPLENQREDMPDGLSGSLRCGRRDLRAAAGTARSAVGAESLVKAEHDVADGGLDQVLRPLPRRRCALRADQVEEARAGQLLGHRCQPARGRSQVGPEGGQRLVVASQPCQADPTAIVPPAACGLLERPQGLLVRALRGGEVADTFRGESQLVKSVPVAGVQ